MPPIKYAALALLLLAVNQSAPVWAEEKAQDAGLQIEVPVPLKPSKAVFNMDHQGGDAAYPLTGRHEAPLHRLPVGRMAAAWEARAVAVCG